ncbi:expressed unknown protein [Seminavis robusta]|uniref:Uncharacterized protein n=1 Tax=Seminavis robusta TaxID=568900 RepID=A0A9N8HYI3_9STRA|nr:expressed unknown protein [Seminavis robusta]|eukprot:Sro2510_g329820.1 n/a (132) ;mRNA; r:7668-8063
MGNVNSHANSDAIVEAVRAESKGRGERTSRANRRRVDGSSNLTKEEIAEVMSKMSPEEILAALEKFARDDDAKMYMECWEAMKEHNTSGKALRRTRTEGDSSRRRQKGEKKTYRRCVTEDRTTQSACNAAA